MINNSEYITKKCSCENPKWEIDRKQKVKSGKNFGKIHYSVHCMSCGARWKTFSTKGIEELIDK